MRSLLLLLLTTALARAAVSPAQLENARALLQGHKLAAAESAANALVAANPNDAEAQALLGRVQLEREDADAAVAACEKAAELAPANSEIRRQLGDAYGLAAQKAGMLGKMSNAKKCRVAYEKAVELDPKNVEARGSLLAFYQQAPGVMGGGMDKAYAQAEAIKQLDAARGHAVFATLYAADKKYDLAFAEFDAVLRNTPDDYGALYQLGKLCALSGQSLDRGLAALRRCLELTPPPNTPGHPAALWRIGNILEKKNDPAGARASYEAALKLDPKFAQAADALKKLP